MPTRSRWSVAAAAVLASAPAYAYETSPKSGCDPVTFSSPPRVVLHLGEAVDLDFFGLLALVAAMEDVHEQFNEVGATSAAVTSLATTLDPFVHGQWFYDAEPTIHVGFTTDPALSGVAAARLGPVDANCQIQEAHIRVDDVGVHPWAFLTPSAYGEPYYDAGQHNPAGEDYFRHSYLHELLHAFGLAHSDSSYAVMNYGDRPWANRAPGAQVRPLPDDVEALRDLYPAAGARTEVAVLDTWFDPADVSDSGAALQKPLCKPSPGGAWGDRFDEFCGAVGGGVIIPEVYTGDGLRTRVAVANYGTTAVTIDQRLYFSSDDTYDATDVPSGSVFRYSLGPQSSSQQGRSFPTPALPVGYYYVIAHVTAVSTSGVVVTDWIPLRGKVQFYPRS